MGAYNAEPHVAGPRRPRLDYRPDRPAAAGRGVGADRRFPPPPRPGGGLLRAGHPRLASPTKPSRRRPKLRPVWVPGQGPDDVRLPRVRVGLAGGRHRPATCGLRVLRPPEAAARADGDLLQDGRVEAGAGARGVHADGVLPARLLRGPRPPDDVDEDRG